MKFGSIINKVKYKLNQEPPNSIYYGKSVSAIIVSALFVFFIVFLFKPSVFYYNSIVDQLMISIILSSIPIILYPLNLFLYKRFFKHLQRSYKNEFFFFFFLFFPIISLLVYIYTLLIGLFVPDKLNPNQGIFLKSFHYGYCVGGLIYISFTLYDYIYYLKKLIKRKEATLHKTAAGKIKIISNTNREIIFLDPGNVIFVESLKNNITIHYMSRDNVVCAEIRKSMKEIEKILDGYSCFLRIHKSFMANISYLCSVESVNNKTLVLLKSGDKLPVSREKSQIVKKIVLSNN